MRRLQPAHARLRRGVRVLEVINIVVGRDPGRRPHELVGDPAQFSYLFRRKDIGDDDEPVALIGLSLRLGQHSISFPTRSLGVHYAYFAATAIVCPSIAGLSAKAGMISRAKRRIFLIEPPKLISTYSTPPSRNASSFFAMSSGVPKIAVSSQRRRTSSSSRAKRSRSSPSGRRDRLLIR